MLTTGDVERRTAVKRSLLSITVIAIVASLFIGTFIGFNSANSQNSKLTNDLTNLQEQYAELQTKYYALWGNYSNIESNYKRILLQSPSMTLTGTGASDAQQYLARYAALQELYRELQAKYAQYQTDYASLQELTDARLMRNSLARFITPADPAVMNITLEVTGELGKAPEAGFDWPDIKAIYDWVNNNIEYREDGLYPELPVNLADIATDGLKHTDQMAQFPNETLSLRMGDCEDTAALLVSMLRAYQSIQVESIWITGVNAGHVAVVIPIEGDKIVILDPVRDYVSHDTLGGIAANSISTEIYDWLNIWRPTLGNDVHVYRIFSDYMDKYFESTEDYITWQYSR
jgi:hypothetical protein